MTLRWKMREETVSVLLCTYNGARYLREQLESLVSQTYKNIQIYIQDDCSNDETRTILAEYEGIYKDILHVKFNDVNSGSSRNNFTSLLNEHVNDSYVAFCDQDDIWETNKIEVLMNRMYQDEAKMENKPLLVCHNYTVVSHDKKYINSIDIPYKNSYQLLINNYIPGCCMMVNSSLLKVYANGLPSHSYMHDWWLVLLASSVGEISIIEDSLLLYRQHDANVIGYENKTKFKRILLVVFSYREKIHTMKKILRQSYEFMQLYNKYFNAEFTSFANMYINFYSNKNKHELGYLLSKHQCFGGGVHNCFSRIVILSTTID